LDGIDKVTWTGPTIEQPVEGIWVFGGYGLAPISIIDTDEGLIAFDTGDTKHDGELLLKALRTVSDKPVKAIIYGMKDGKVSYVYNWLGKERYTIASPDTLPSGKATIQFEFAEGGEKIGAGGTGKLSINGKKVAEGQIENTVPAVFSGDETADVGLDSATPVTEDYKERHNEFNGKIVKVTVELK